MSITKMIRDEAASGATPTFVREAYQSELDAELSKRALQGEHAGDTLARLAEDPVVAGLYAAMLKAKPLPAAEPAPTPKGTRAKYEAVIQKSAELRSAASGGKETVEAAYAAILAEDPGLYDALHDAPLD